MSCSAAEIAEKKRIALEKLKSKKSQLTTAANGKNNKLTPAQFVSKNFVAAKSSNQTQSQTLPTPKVGDNSASYSSFLSDVKGSNMFKQRQEQQHSARDAAHPYKRPPPASPMESSNFYKKSTDGVLNVKTNEPQFSLGQPTNNVAFPVNRNSISCKVTMIATNRFEVQASGYHEKLIEMYKSIPSKSYDPVTRYWNFALDDYKLLQERVNYLKPDVVMGVIPRNVLNLCLEPIKEVNKSCLESIEPVLAAKLMPFQQEGVCFAISRNGRCMISDEMGLGKTYQAIAVADFYKEDWPLFICTNVSTRDSWADHIRTLLPSIPLHYVQILTTNQQYIGDCKVLITTYSMIEKNIQKILERKFGFVIFDESQIVKNPKAKCTMVADRLAQQAKHVIMLSGTPVLSRPLELFSQLQMIDKKFMSYIDFTSRYCDGKQTKFGWDATGQSNLKELNVVLKLKYMIRRTKADVLSDLSEKSREIVLLDPALVWPSDEVKKSLDTVAKNLQCSKGHDREQILLTFYAQTAEVKTKAVCSYIKQQVKEPKKFIVFAHHRIMLDAISACLEKLKVKFVRIDGSTRKQDRGEFIDRFQKKSSCKVAVLSLLACNSGITLTAAEIILFAELTWTPSILAQAESRAHRIGQTKPVSCRYLMASKTADDHIWNMLNDKQNTLNKAGLLCENLQDATHTAVPSTSNKIENYFSPTKQLASGQSSKTEETSIKGSSSATSLNEHLDISKEIENIEDFFQDDDDEAFKDILC